jgi:hypothetical protein
MRRKLIALMFSLLGGVLGGILGYYAFFWIARQGFYVIALPGTLLGAGCGLFSRDNSLVRGIICGVAGLGLGIYTEWSWGPFKEDPSLVFFLTHLHLNPLITLLLIALGAVLAFWFGKGHWYGRDKTPTAERHGS